MSVLSVQGVWKSYGDRAVLRGIDLEVAAHEVVALIGASGSGKSTLLKTIDLLERVDDGRILLGGDDIPDPRADPDGVRARIGVVFQSYNLFPHRTILDNVTLGLRAVHRVPRDEATRRGAELLERVGLEVDADQRQKMAALTVAGPKNFVVPVRVFPALALLPVEPAQAGDEIRFQMFAAAAEGFPGLLDVQVLEKHPQRSVQNAPRGDDAEGEDSGPDQPSHVKNPLPCRWTARQDDAL